MQQIKVTLKVHLRWWYKFYMWGLEFCVFYLRLEPDWDKVDYWLKKAIYVEIQK